MSSYTRGWKTSSIKKPRSPRERGLVKRCLRFLRKLLISFLRVKGLWRKLFLLGVFLGILGFVIVGLTFVYYSFNLPDPNRLADRIVPESTKILDRNGEILYEIHGDTKRTLVPLQEIPDHVQKSFIAIEDKNFYQHGGISFTGIARAIVLNIFTSESPGGSTITQQFARNAVLTREKTITRKVKEIILSLQLERKYSKDEILQLYLNEIPFGSTIYGIESAAQSFFGKPVQELTLTETSYLAALPQSPTYYSPYGPNRELLDRRADVVVQLMYEQGYITEQERNRAQNLEPEFRELGAGILAPHFVLYVQDLLAQEYGEVSLQEGGLRVTTTLDLELQKIAEEAVTNQSETNETTYRATNAALVAIDPRTGQVLAMVGSRDYFNEDIDGAVNVTLRPRQPGSSFKPYVYASAFEQGMNPATLLMDVKTNFGEFGEENKEYVPQNYDGLERGPVSIRTALAGSLNIPAVKTIILTGIDNAIDVAEGMGITTLADRSRFGPSLVLGGGEVKLLEHTAAFGIFATGGIKHDTTVILKVEDKDGRVLEEWRESRGREALNPQIAYQINNVLSDNEARVFIFGQNNRLQLPGRPAAAKTGTTQGNRDNWTVGYTPSLVAGVWVGNNDNSPMTERAFGSSTAAPIWNAFMRRALEGKPVENFERPDGIVEIEVDTLSGKLPTAHTPSTKTEVFASFNVPRESDNVHIPPYTILHSEMPNNPNWEDPVRAWAVANGYAYPEGFVIPDQPELETDIKISIQVPDRVASLPWQVRGQIESPDEIAEVLLILDGNIIGTFAEDIFEYTSTKAHVDGTHEVRVSVKTVSNRGNQRVAPLEFSLGRNVSILFPQDNQRLSFPANVTLESNINLAPENIKFKIRSTAGQETSILGRISKQQIGDIYHYTLNWAATEKPKPGSYALYGDINGNLSEEIVVIVP